MGFQTYYTHICRHARRQCALCIHCLERKKDQASVGFKTPTKQIRLPGCVVGRKCLLKSECMYNAAPACLRRFESCCTAHVSMATCSVQARNSHGNEDGKCDSQNASYKGLGGCRGRVIQQAHDGGLGCDAVAEIAQLDFCTVTTGYQ